MGAYSVLDQLEELRVEICLFKKEIETLRNDIFLMKGEIIEDKKAITKASDAFNHFCKIYGFSVRAIKGSRRERVLVNERYIIAKEMHDAGFSTSVIGRMFNRDQSTIVHLLKRGIVE